MRNPTVAVLIATYNGERFLKEQLESILSQTYKNFKIYISDDSSSDSTVKILKYYKTKYPQIFFYSVNEKNIGFIKNFEKLLLACTEDYVALSDQDDIWNINKLEIQMTYLLEYESLNNENYPCLIHSDLQMIDKESNVIKKSFLKYRKINLPEKKSLNKIISHNGVMGCSILMNKSLCKKILPFPEKLDMPDYWIALVNEVIGKRITITKQLVLYRIHDNNTSNSIQKIQYHRNILQRFFNNDKLPFTNLGREEVLEEIKTRFDHELQIADKQVILSFVCYLKNCKSFFQIFYELIKYNLIREDFKYRLKIFIKLIQRNLQN